ncbi:MAG: hypothetical protein GY838_09200, partial [bacterium]|nr:hypothetical protein [bacterium]
YIRGHPGDYARLVGRKWAIFFASWRLGWTQWDWPGGLRGIRRPVDLFSPTSTIGVWLMAPLTLMGLVASFLAPGPSRRWAVLVLLMSAASLATAALFFGYVRQGVLLIPFCLALVATALVAAGRWLADRKDLAKRLALGPSRRLLAILGAVALVLLLIEAWGATANRNYR